MTITLPADIPRDWARAGSCRRPGVDYSLWFTEGDCGPAKRVCEGCPVVNICLRVALITQDFEYVLGATTGKERKEMMRAAGLLKRKRVRYPSERKPKRKSPAKVPA